MNDEIANTIQGIRTLYWPAGPGKGPIKMPALKLAMLSGLKARVINLRRDYYVVPPKRRACRQA